MTLYHYTRLSDKIVDTIHNIINNSEFTYSHHARTQKENKRVSDWKHIAKHGTIIEFNKDETGRRHKALLRTPDGHCAVFGLATKQIVTMWKNAANDNHSTLDPSKYEGGVVWNRI